MQNVGATGDGGVPTRVCTEIGCGKREAIAGVHLFADGGAYGAFLREIADRCANIVAALQQLSDHPAADIARSAGHQHCLGHGRLPCSLSLQAYT